MFKSKRFCIKSHLANQETTSHTTPDHREKIGFRAH